MWHWLQDEGLQLTFTINALYYILIMYSDDPGLRNTSQCLGKAKI